MEMIDLNTVWFILLGILLTGYAILDGFDLGVGMLHYLAKTDYERRIIINSIGPLWDGNEVWLVTFGGALFAAFPEAYATAFSGFYFAFMVVLFCLIFRAVSIEFRSKMNSKVWRSAWDFGFFASSSIVTLVYGVAVGAALIGIPLNQRGIFIGGIYDQIGWFQLIVGVMTISMFVMHGAIFLYLKTEGPLQKRVHRWTWIGFFAFVIMFVVTTVSTFASVPTVFDSFTERPWGWIIVLLNVLAIANIPRALHMAKPGYAFVSSCCSIAAFVFLFGFELFPNLITSTPTAEHSLTIYNSASSKSTLRTMLLIAAIGVPFFLAYSSIVYWTFRGKVKLDEHSY